MPHAPPSSPRSAGGLAALALAGALLASGLGSGLLGGCRNGAAEGLEALGIPTLMEVPVERARRALAADQAVLVQRRAAGERLPPLPGATALHDGEEPPPSWARDGRRHLVIASERREALALAARLRRAGVERVGVVTGDPATLGEPRTAAAQPAPTRNHPTRPRAGEAASPRP